MIPAEIIYIAHLLSIWSLSPVHIPYLRFYVGAYVSIIGACSIGGAYFPQAFSEVLLKFIQAFAIVDMLNSRTLHDIIQHIALIYVSDALKGAPDLQHIPTLYVSAIAPTYYVAGAIWPSVFIGRIYAILLITCSLLYPLYTVSTTAMTSYLFNIYMIACTYGSYSIGVYVNSYP
jgi:hypothetical protein